MILVADGDVNQPARDCADIKARGEHSSGVYTVYIGQPPRPTQVYCDMTTDGGSWLVCISFFIYLFT